LESIGKTRLSAVVGGVVIAGCLCLAGMPDAQGQPDLTLPLHGLTPADESSRSQLNKVVQESEKTGAIFSDAEQIIVNPPILSALITINKNFSPFQLDATAARPINLHDALVESLGSNLPIKIAATEATIKHWLYKSTLGGFLPDIGNQISFEGLHGNYVSPGGLIIPIRNPFLDMQTGFTQYFFKGGSVIYGAAEAKHQFRAATALSKGTINDILNDTTKLYYDLVLNDVLLQIQVKSVEVAKAFVIVQEDQFANGANTKLDVLQAKYELSKDRQQLISQQIKRRQAAVNLATVMNLNPTNDLVIGTKHVSKTRLVDEKLMPGDLIRIAIDHRPELKRFEELRLAAKDAIKVARAALLPTVAGVGNIIGTGSRAASLTATSNSQQTPLSGSGVGVGSASSGALPLAPGPTGAPRRFSAQTLGVIGVDVQYNLGGLGWTELAKVEAARYDARKAQLEFNRELTKIYQDVRDSYLQSMEAEQLIVETTDAVNYAEEALRVSEVRLKNGVATYLDLITAQRNYTAALIDKANAIIKFNVAQAAIVHAVGRSTVETLTTTSPMRN